MFIVIRCKHCGQFYEVDLDCGDDNLRFIRLRAIDQSLCTSCWLSTPEGATAVDIICDLMFPEFGGELQ